MMNIKLDPGFRVEPSVSTQTSHDRSQPNLKRDPLEQRPRSPTKSRNLGEAVTRLEHHVQAVRRELHFRVDEVTGMIVVRVVNKDTGELVRQIPNQEVLDLAEQLDDNAGALLREKV